MSRRLPTTPNHLQNLSNIYIIYIKHIFYIYLYIFMSMLIFGMIIGLFKNIFSSELTFFWSFSMGYQLTTGPVDPNTLEIMFFPYSTSNSSIVWLFVRFEWISGKWVDLRLHRNFWPPTYLLKIPARNRLTYVFKGQTDFWSC